MKWRYSGDQFDSLLEVNMEVAEVVIFPKAQ